MKYPRTYHHPASPGTQNDDKIISAEDLANFIGKNLTISEKIDGCLRDTTRITLSDGTKKFIRDIVNSDKEFEVLGVDDNGEIIPTKVINKFKNGPTDDWYKIELTRNKLSGNNYGSVYATPNHKFFNVDRNKYVKLENLIVGDKIYVYSENQSDLNYIQKQVIVGTMLGDGSYIKHPTSDSGHITFGHIISKKEYADWKKHLLGDLYKACEFHKSGYGSEMYRIRTRNTKSTAEICDQFKKDGVKIVPMSIESDFGPLALAIWYCDDGSLSHNDGQQDRAALATNGFDEQSLDNLIKILKNKFNIDAVKQIEILKGTSLRMCKDSADILFAIISPYLPACMQYKLPNYYRNEKEWRPIIEYGGKSSLTVQEITKIEKASLRSKQKYDLETETHNFFANDILVHNSNTCIRDGEIYNRSHASPASHKSFHWYKQYYQNHLKHRLPVSSDPHFFEYCYAVHSIKYDALPHYLFLLTIRGETLFYSQEDVESEAEWLGVPTAPVLLRDFRPKSTSELERVMKSFMTDEGVYGKREGIVVRIQDEFPVDEFHKSVVKMVKKDFVPGGAEHWANKPIERQKLIGEL